MHASVVKTEQFGGFIEMTASYFIGVTENGASAIGGGGGGVSCRSFATWTIKRYRGTTGRRAITV